VNNWLVTGFEPFGQMARNPSGEILAPLAKILTSRHDRKIYTLVLPVSYQRSGAVLQHWYNRHPLELELIVALGVHRGHFFRFESQACSPFASQAVDADGVVAQSLAMPEELLTAQFPLDAMVADLATQSPWPMQVSNNAGGYVCEAVYREVLSLASQKGNRFGLFVHIPHFSHIHAQSQLEFLLQVFAWIASFIETKASR